jgi:hypothetical protein
MTRHDRWAEDPDRPVDLVVEVDHALALELGAVLRPHLGEAVDVSVVPSFDVDRVGQPEADRAQRLDPRCDRISVAPLGEADQLRQQAADVGLVDRSPRSRLGEERRDPVDDGQRDRVQRADLQSR